MNIKILLLAISAASLGSCSTTYKSGQTPDDVYFSPIRPVEEARQLKEVVRTTDYEERQIRMSTYDRRWRYINEDYNYDYTYSPYRYGYDYGYYYNPYYYPCPVYIKGVAITNPRNTTPRMANLRTYTYKPVITNQKTYGSYQVNSTKAYTNSNRNAGTFVRKILNAAQYNTNDNNNSSTRENNNTRTYSPSNNNSNNSSNSSNNSQSSGSVSRPSRGNN